MSEDGVDKFTANLKFILKILGGIARVLCIPEHLLIDHGQEVGEISNEVVSVLMVGQQFRQ